MRKIIASLYITALSVCAYAQDTARIDFDADGVADKISIQKISEEKFKLVYTLSTKGKGKRVSGVFNSMADANSLTVKGSVCKLNFQYMRSRYVFTFRYNKATGDVMLIGYDNEQYGNATNDGSGKSSYNFNTRTYLAQWYYWNAEQDKLLPLAPIQKKWALKPIAMQNFSDQIIETIMQTETANKPLSIK